MGEEKSTLNEDSISNIQELSNAAPQDKKKKEKGKKKKS